MMRSCDTMREDFSALLDGELTPFEQAEIEAHLSECSECLRILGGMKKVDDLYRALEPAVAPGDFEERLKQRLRPKVRLFTGRRMATRRIWLLAAAGLIAVLSLFLMRMQTPSPDHMQLTRAQEPPTAPKGGLMTEAEMARPMPPPPAPLAVAEPAATADTHTEALPEQAAAAPASPPRADMPQPEVHGDGVAMQYPVRTSALGGARAPQKMPIQHVGPRAFTLVEGVWREEGYAGEPATPLLRQSEEFHALCERHPDLPAIAALGPTVIFRLEETWRQIETPADTAGH